MLSIGLDVLDILMGGRVVTGYRIIHLEQDALESTFLKGLIFLTGGNL
jgi:hypothetical protein